MGQRWKRPEQLEQNRLCPHGISACVMSWVTQMIHGSCSGRSPFSPWVRGTELLLSAAEGGRLLDDDVRVHGQNVWQSTGGITNHHNLKIT